MYARIKKGKTKDWEKLLTHMQRIHQLNIKVGYFTEQGLHSSGDHYTKIMRIHEDGLDNKPARKVLTIGTLEMQAGDSAIFNSSVNNMISRLGKVTSTSKLVAEACKEHIQTIFGDSSKLVVTSNPTPLIDTGELVENLTYKVE